MAGASLSALHRAPAISAHLALLDQLGHTVTNSVEAVRSRMPTNDEARTLSLPGGIPVICVRRRTYADSRVVEVALDVVLPADRTEWEYEASFQGH